MSDALPAMLLWMAAFAWLWLRGAELVGGMVRRRVERGLSAPAPRAATRPRDDQVVRAMGVIAQYGERLRRCEACSDVSTTHELLSFAALTVEGGDELQMVVQVAEHCGNCGRDHEYSMHPLTFAAIEASSVIAKSSMAFEGIIAELEDEDSAD